MLLWRAKQRCYSKAVARARHEVSDDALVSLAFVDLSELLCIVHLHSNAILKDIMDLLRILLGEVHWVRPCDLDGGACLRHVRELSLEKWLTFNHYEMFIDWILLSFLMLLLLLLLLVGDATVEA